MIDLVAFDLDGTVLDPQSRLTDTAAATIADLVLRGITAVSISGRSIRRTLEAFEGHSQLVSGLYLAGYNGSVIVGPDAGSGRPVMHEDRLDADIFVELARYAHGANLNLVCAQFERIDGEVVEEYRHAQPVDGLEAFGGPGFVLDPDLYSRCLVGDYKPPPMAIMVVDPDERPGHIADLEALGGAQVNVSWALPDRVQVMRRGVDKGRALMMLAQQMGVPLERVLAIGDADNDLPMLRAAGIGVLMGNAKEPVRAAVQGEGMRIGPTLAEDGFATMVREYALTG